MIGKDKPGGYSMECPNCCEKYWTLDFLPLTFLSTSFSFSTVLVDQVGTVTTVCGNCDLGSILPKDTCCTVLYTGYLLIVLFTILSTLYSLNMNYCINI